MDEKNFEIHRKSIRTALSFVDRVVDFNVYIVGSASVGKSALVTTLNNFFGFMGVQGLTVSSRSDIDTSEIDENSFVIFLYDICSQDSFNSICRSHMILSTPTFKSVLVGNKLDLEYWRKVTIASALNQARSMGTTLVEISTKLGIHLDIICDLILNCAFQELNDDHYFNEVISRLTILRSQSQRASSEQLQGIIKSPLDPQLPPSPPATIALAPVSVEMKRRSKHSSALAEASVRKDTHDVTRMKIDDDEQRMHDAIDILVRRSAEIHLNLEEQGMDLSKMQEAEVVVDRMKRMDDYIDDDDIERSEVDAQSYLEDMDIEKSRSTVDLWTKKSVQRDYNREINFKFDIICIAYFI
jgi:GTPase SAR1 family protein